MNYFITGGSRGLGAGLVRGLAAHGHCVFFTYSKNKDAAARIAQEVEAGGKGRCAFTAMDVEAPGEVDAAAEQAIERLGSIDVVINNAGLNLPGLAVTLSDADWGRVIGVNLTGCFHVCRAFLMPFLAQGGGQFIHMGSIAAAGMKGEVAYSASKAGLEGLSASLAKEYGARGIRSNVLRLGLADTDMSRETGANELAELWIKHCPVGRLMTARDVLAAVTFLSEGGSDFINGAVIEVSGGLEQIG